MKMGNAYIFLDYFMTTNELIDGEKVHDKRFEEFSSAIQRLESASGLCAHLVIISGTNENSARRVFSLLKPKFDAVDVNFDGFAFEYGGYILEGSGEVRRIYNKKTELGDKIDALCSKYSFAPSDRYNLYYCFEFDKMGKGEECFINECKSTFKGYDFEVYNDQYGIGLDIKNSDLNKEEFIKLYLKRRRAEMLIVGGDSSQDLVMLSYEKVPRKFFVGFKKLTKERKENIILSDKENVAGICDDIDKISEILEEKH